MNRINFFRRWTWLPIIAVTISLFLSGCGSTDLPLKRLKASLKDAPSYSILLEDMKTDGNFVKTFFHKYRVIQEGSSESEGGLTDWMEVPEKYYKDNEAFLGMTLASKIEGQESSYVSPPGYGYVGNARYGRWRDDGRGSSFWEFYGKYALFSHLVGGWYRPIYRHDYNGYSRYRKRNHIYYGTNSQYGTSGRVAKNAKPSFFNRRAAKTKVASSSFNKRVASRVGRTRTGYRGRSGGFGK
jgi:hypothetical protein